MSETQDVDEERTDPSIALPEVRDPPTEERTLDMDPLPPPPPPPKRDASSPPDSRPTNPTEEGVSVPPLPPPGRLPSELPRVGTSISRPPTSRLPPLRPISAGPPPSAGPPTSVGARRTPMGAVATPVRERAAADQSPPTRASQFPPSRASRPPPAVRPGSIPPPRMPKPTDPPPPPNELGPPQRQRLGQMETQLDQARSAMARQRHEIDELRSKLDAREQRLDGLMDALEGAPSRAMLEERLSQVESRRNALAQELRGRVDELGHGGERLEGLEARVAVLEEGIEASRIRMRLEIMGHRLSELEESLEELGAAQAAARAQLEQAAKRDERISRLESLFDELAQELRGARQIADVTALVARLDDVEALVVRSGEQLAARRGELEETLERVEKLASMPPPAPTASSDDLTRIKGIWPKYARMLNDAGVTTFAQIAAWTEEELAHVAAALGVQPKRIHKAGWVESATKLIG